MTADLALSARPVSMGPRFRGDDETSHINKEL